MILKFRKFKIKKFSDKRGNLCFLEKKNGLSFQIKRIYYFYNTRFLVKRGVHAHQKLEQIFLAINGKFKIKIDDGKKKKYYVLSKPSEAIYIPPMTWREIVPLKKNSTFLVLASRVYEKKDYIFEYKKFLKKIKK